VKKLVFDYVPNIGTDSSGYVILTYNYDPNNSPPTNSAQARMEPLVVKGPSYHPLRLVVPARQTQKYLLNRLGTKTTLATYFTSAGPDYDYGAFQWFAKGYNGDMGTIEVSYEIELLDHEPLLTTAPLLSALLVQRVRQDPLDPQAQEDHKDPLVLKDLLAMTDLRALPESRVSLDSQAFQALLDHLARPGQPAQRELLARLVPRISPTAP